MQIVVNHVTRMGAPRICVAGVDPVSFQHVRPTTPPTDLITRSLMRAEGGPFGPGALVDIGSAAPAPSPPETEDHHFATKAARHLEDLDDDTYLELLHKVSDADIHSAFGPELLEIRPRKFAVQAGHGSCSLAVVSVVEPLLRIEFGNLYLDVGASHERAKLRVTDARFYEKDHETVKRDVFYDVRRRLSSGTPAYLMLGLARALPDADAGEVHWLMANGLCLGDRAVSDTP